MASCTLTSVFVSVLSVHVLFSRQALLSGFYCEPAVKWPVPVSCMSLKLLSGPGCDGWAEEDPEIQASACSSSVLSSVE